uniref:Uncharacterized protein n=1 Tax=Arundo donax TaxID=35708 RepID=A0A0A9E208_ARUDO
MIDTNGKELKNAAATTNPCTYIFVCSILCFLGGWREFYMLASTLYDTGLQKSDMVVLKVRVLGWYQVTPSLELPPVSQVFFCTCKTAIIPFIIINTVQRGACTFYFLQLKL